MQQQEYSELEVRRQPSSRLPLLLAVLLLFLLLPLAFLFSRWLLDSCLQAAQSTRTEVLGITNLSVDGNLNQASGGDVVTFNVVGNNTGPLSNGVVTFDTFGKGTIQSAPVGSGICIVTSNTQATCTAVNLLSNEQLSYAVPVLVDTVCGQTNGDVVGLTVDVNDLTDSIQDGTASGNVGCTAEAAASSSNSSNSSVSSSTASSSNSSSSSDQIVDTTLTNGAVVKVTDSQLAACYVYSSNGLLIGAGISLLLALVIFLVGTWLTRREYRYENV